MIIEECAISGIIHRSDRQRNLQLHTAEPEEDRTATGCGCVILAVVICAIFFHLEAIVSY